MPATAVQNPYIRAYAPFVKREVHLNPFVKKRCKCTCTRVHRYGGVEFEKLHCITYITGIDCCVVWGGIMRPPMLST